MNETALVATDAQPDFGIMAVVFNPRGVCTYASVEARRVLALGDTVGRALDELFGKAFTEQQSLERHGSLIAAHNDRLFHHGWRTMPDGSLQVVLTDVSVSTRAFDPDGLEGLPDRSALKTRIDALVTSSRAAGLMVAVHHLDLDRFKGINESLGHAMGDVLLRKVAERVGTLLKPGDIMGRLGGDEFILVQTDIENADTARSRAERIVDLVGRSYVLQGQMLNIGASVGVALSDDRDVDAEMLLRRADLALYRAKAEGRGIARFFEPEMQARTQIRRALESDLRLALARREFTLQYQPLHDLSSDRITGFEALLRWTHVERGPVPPMAFIPLAEEIGLIGAIGRWVLRTACREAMAWPEAASVAVNISPHQFKGGSLVEDVTAALASTGLPATRLELEITESALLDETNLVLRALNQLRERGVRISMDDFGTGYSSLSYLRKFPFDKIKIDQSFVRGLGVDGDCDAIVRAVSTLGASLGIRTTAEGVETSDQLNRIRQEGCTEVQGFLLGEPLVAEDARALLARQKGR